MNDDLYDTGSAVVRLYRLFANLLKFPWLGGGGGGVCPWDHRIFPLISFIFHTSFN